MICEGSPKGNFVVITQKCNKTANINVKSQKGDITQQHIDI